MYFGGLDARPSVARRELRCLQISIKPVCSLARKERSDGIAIVAHCANRVTTEYGLLSNTSHTSKRKTPRQKWEEVDFAETPHTGTSRQSVTAREACCLIIWLPLPCGSRAPPKTSGFERLPHSPRKRHNQIGCVFFVVGGGGFEPPKSETSDLQSDAFGHSAIRPY